MVKSALVVAGYLAAGLIARLVVAGYEAATATDAKGAEGMYAFGDLFLFLAVFGALALIPTFVAIRLFRSRRR